MGRLQCNDPAFAKALHQHGVKHLAPGRRGQIQTHHAGLIEFLPACGEILCDLGRTGGRTQTQQKIGCKIEMARGALEPAVFVGQIGMLASELGRSGVGRLAVIRH